MASKIKWNKVFLIFFFMFVLGFLIGYDYGLVTVHKNIIKQEEKNDEYEMHKMGETGLTDYSAKDIMNKN